MIIKINQTASNIKQEYEIEGDSFCFRGKAGSFSPFQNIVVSNKTDTISGIFHFSPLVNYIPFRHLFGKTCLSRAFCLYKNNIEYGSIAYSKDGLYKNCYIITLNSGEVLNCYALSKGSYDYVSVYQGDKQIALIETYLSVNDYKYKHKLYLLDDYKAFYEVLPFFAVYYSSFTFAQRQHMTYASSTRSGVVWDFSGYRHKYDPNWRETNFPHENFFGKTNLFE